jgi:hypothetical protein
MFAFKTLMAMGSSPLVKVFTTQEITVKSLRRSVKKDLVRFNRSKTQCRSDVVGNQS